MPEGRKQGNQWRKSSKSEMISGCLSMAAEEQQRHGQPKPHEGQSQATRCRPLIAMANICKADCLHFPTTLQDAGLELPRIYKQGYPNANCIGCVKATSVTYWNHVRKMHPDVFKERNKQSKSIGCKLVRYKGKRIFLDELPPDAVGKPLKNLDFECGIFCDMK